MTRNKRQNKTKSSAPNQPSTHHLLSAEELRNVTGGNGILIVHRPPDERD